MHTRHSPHSPQPFQTARPPPKYLLATAQDVAGEVMRLSRIEGLIHCTSGRWWLRNPDKARALLKRGSRAE